MSTIFRTPPQKNSSASKIDSSARESIEDSPMAPPQFEETSNGQSGETANNSSSSIEKSPCINANNSASNSASKKGKKMHHTKDEIKEIINNFDKNEIKLDTSFNATKGFEAIRNLAKESYEIMKLNAKSVVSEQREATELRLSKIFNYANSMANATKKNNKSDNKSECDALKQKLQSSEKQLCDLKIELQSTQEQLKSANEEITMLKEQINSTTIITGDASNNEVFDASMQNSSSDLMKEILHRIAGLEEKLKQTNQPKVSQVKTYASTLNAPSYAPSIMHKVAKSVNTPIVPKGVIGTPSFAVIVKSSINADTTKEINEKLRKNRVGFKIGSAPSKIYNLNKDSIKMEFKSIEEQEKAIKVLNDDGCFKARAPEKFKPSIILKGIPSWIEPKELSELIIKQNCIEEIIPDLKREDLVFKFKIKPRYIKDLSKQNNAPYNAVMETSQKMYRVLYTLNTLNVDIKRVYVTQYIPTKQCYRCLGFGHIAKKCLEKSKNNKESCSFCAKDHKYADCPDKKNKNIKPKCKNCIKFDAKYKTKTDVHHLATSSKCPCFEEYKARVTNNVNW